MKQKTEPKLLFDPNCPGVYPHVFAGLCHVCEKEKQCSKKSYAQNVAALKCQARMLFAIIAKKNIPHATEAQIKEAIDEAEKRVATEDDGVCIQCPSCGVPLKDQSMVGSLCWYCERNGVQVERPIDKIRAANEDEHLDSFEHWVGGLGVTPRIPLFPSNDRVLTDIEKLRTHNAVNHPKHYNSHPSGIECIQITEHMNFCMGNAIKYIWRADHANGLEDLKKARWYLDREIQKREKTN